MSLDLSEYLTGSFAYSLEKYKPVVELASNALSYKNICLWTELGTSYNYYMCLMKDDAVYTRFVALKQWNGRWDMLHRYMLETDFPARKPDHIKRGSLQPAYQGTTYLQLPRDFAIRAKILVGDALEFPTEEEFDLAVDRSRRK